MLLGLRSGGAGKALYTTLTGFAFGLCLLAGVLLTADCLSEEKREGTLGLLFLTDLKGYDVVLGKFMAMVAERRSTGCWRSCPSPGCACCWGA